MLRLQRQTQTITSLPLARLQQDTLKESLPCQSSCRMARQSFSPTRARRTSTHPSSVTRRTTPSRHPHRRQGSRSIRLKLSKGQYRSDSLSRQLATNNCIKSTGLPTAPVTTRYRCFLPDLAGLAGLRRVGPGTTQVYHPHASQIGSQLTPESRKLNAKS